jgi:hypothetical protein
MTFDVGGALARAGVGAAAFCPKATKHAASASDGSSMKVRR